MRSTFDVVVLFLLAIANVARAQPAATPAPPPAAEAPDQAKLEKEFAEKMTNVVMNGQYTVGNGAPKADKYTIVSVEKLKGDNWLFKARVQFGDHDFTMPMIIPIKWAGDTAVISVTDFGIPGMGTYTARVLIYKEQYAGTWSGAGGGGPHGGHMWGKLEKAKPADADKPPSAPKQ
jgi:hypothetical protein